MNARPEVPRIHPLGEAEYDDAQRELLARLLRGPTTNVYLTIARHPELADRMTSLGAALRGDGLPVRHRETLILRAGWRCRSNYEFAQHRRLARDAGMDEADIERIIEGPDAPGWEPFEATLCRAADELHDDGCITDDTWDAMAREYDEQQLIQATMLVGYYHLVSYVLNSLGVALEPGARGYEET
jgi:4-carboxymuconolactone decarboxylase